MFTSAAPLATTAGQKAELEALVRNGNSPQKVALRCRVLLLSCQGIANHAIAQQLSISRPTILGLRVVFAKDGITAVTRIRRRKRQGEVLTVELDQRILGRSGYLRRCSRRNCCCVASAKVPMLWPGSNGGK